MATSLTNAQIAAAFDELADLYELDGAIIHRVLAYRTAAKAVREAPVSVIKLAREGKVTELAGIGKTLEEKIAALDTTGDIPSAVKLRAKYPVGLIAVMHLPGFGPKRARRLYDELQVDSLDALKAAAEAGSIRKLRGFGAKVEVALLAALEAGADGSPAPRVLISRALRIGEQIVGALQAHPGADRVELAGSVRRMADSAKDLDVIATATDPAGLVATLRELPLIEQIQSEGDAGARVVTHTGMKVDLKVVEPDQFGNVLQHLTGSKLHNVALREAAVRRGLHVSEYGITSDDGDEWRCESEEEVYDRLGLAWIPPELREDRGELQAAASGTLPALVTEGDIKGDLHSHTVASDGRGTVEEMLAAARTRGLEYLCITDHSASHGFGNHVTADHLWRQVEKVRALNASLDGFELLIGTESNIGLDGEPDYPEDLLRELDWVVGSVHTRFAMDMTERLVTAIEHPLIDCIGHPTGRKIETRQPYAVDMDAVIEAAARTHTMLEINSAPDRRDLNELHARAASDAGVWIVINTDTHSVRNFELLTYGVATARRAWLTPEKVANTRPWAEFATLRKRARG